MHGNGVYKYPDGRIYEGEFVNNVKHGYGILTFPDGSSCKG